MGTYAKKLQAEIFGNDCTIVWEYDEGYPTIIKIEDQKLKKNFSFDKDFWFEAVDKLNEAFVAHQIQTGEDL